MAFSLKRIGAGLATGGLSEIGIAIDQSVFKPGRDRVNSAKAEEQPLKDLQLTQLQDSISLQNKLLPLQLSSMGLVDDGQGGFRKMTEDERVAAMSPLERSEYELSKSILDRQGKALRGELELPTWLQSDLDNQASVSDEAIARAYGPNAYASTGGIQAKTAQTTEGARIKDAYSHGELELGSRLFGQYAGGANTLNQQTLSNFQSATNPSQGLLSSINAVKNPYTQNTMLQDQLNQQGQQAFWGGLAQLTGTIAGSRMKPA